MIKMVGYDMAAGGREAGLRGGRRRPRGRRRRRAARLLHHQRAAHLRGARPVARRAGREVHLGRRQHLRRQASSPTRRAACSPRATRSARPASRSAPSSSGSCAGRPRSARSRASRLALQHNLGLGGACVVTLYEKVGPDDSTGRGSAGPARRSRRRRARPAAFFAKAIGETDPSTPTSTPPGRPATGPAGAADLPLRRSSSTAPTRSATSTELGIDLRAVLHGEQEFIYHQLAYAGDELTFVRAGQSTSTRRRAARWSSSSTRDCGHRPGRTSSSRTLSNTSWSGARTGGAA